MLVTEGGDDRAMAWLRERAEVLEAALGDAGFGDALSRAHGLSVRSYTRVDAPLLDAAPNLRVVGRGGVGLETIDVAECRRRGVEVVYTPDANTRAVAEYVAGMMVRLVRPLHANRLEPWTAGHFKRLRQDAGEHLHDLTLGVLGMGRVGRAVARIAQSGFGMRVVYHDVADVSDSVGVPAEAVGFDDLLGGCDLLSLHVDGRPGNRHLVDADALGRGNFRFLINTSRGLVLDAAALGPAFASGRLWAAAVDVFDPEPPPGDSPWPALVARWPDRLTLTPHMASRTRVAVGNMGWVVRDVMNVLEGRPPAHPAPG